VCTGRAGADDGRQRCSALNNFATARSILAALDSSTIARLQQTWTALAAKHQATLESLRKLADHSRNYHEYRTRLRNTPPPAVPFLGASRRAMCGEDVLMYAGAGRAVPDGPDVLPRGESVAPGVAA
jgi:hypothetical protein